MSSEAAPLPSSMPSASAPSGLMSISKAKLIGLVLIFDLFVMWAIGLFAMLYLSKGVVLESLSAGITVLTLPVLTVYLLRRLWAYTIPSLGAFPQQTRRLIFAFTGAFVVVMGICFVLGIEMVWHRRWLVLWYALALVAMVAFRLVISTSIARATRDGELARRAVIVGGGKTTEDLITRLERSGEKAIRILGLFDDRLDDRSPETVGRYRKIGTFDELERYCRDNEVDLLIVALPQSAEDRILFLLRKLWILPLDVRIAAHTAKLKLSKRAYTYIGDVPFLAVFDRPLSDWNWALKALFDRVVAAIALLLLSPVMLVVAAMVKFESRGPVFFRQIRHGFNNEPIRVWKFRSMYTDLTDHNGAKQVTKGDPRVTRVGRIIRKTSLDELPQLFNVLTGELSLVGPRPHAMASKAANLLYQDVVDGYFARHRMKPGITGWAQINGWRGETDTIDKIEQRVEHDLFYIDNWSLALDAYILAMTPISLINTKNAY